MGVRQRKSGADRRQASLREVRKVSRRLAREVLRITRRGRRKIPSELLSEARREALELRAAARSRATSRDRLEQRLAELDALLEGPLSAYRPSAIREYAESILVAVFIALFIRAFFFEAFQIPTGSMIPTLRVGDHLFVNKLIYGVRIPWTRIRFFDWRTPERGEIVVFQYPGPGPEHGKDFIKRVVAVAGDRVRMEGYRLYVNGEPQFSLPISPNVDQREERVPDFLAALMGGLVGPPQIWLGMTCNDPRNDPCNCQVKFERVGRYGYVTQHHRAPCVGAPDWPKAAPRCSPLLHGDCMYFGAQADNPHWPEVEVPEGSVFCIGDNRDNSSDGRYWGLVPLESVKGKALVIWWASDWTRMFSLVH